MIMLDGRSGRWWLTASVRAMVFLLAGFGCEPTVWAQDCEPTVWAQDEVSKADPAVADPAVVAAPAIAEPVLPPYFTATSLDPKAPFWPDPTGGKAGYWITPAKGPVGDGDPSTKTPGDLYDRIAHNMFSINMVWVLITGFLVMFMQTGFMLVEVGLRRAKNTSHTAAMNLMIYPLGCVAFWAYGFALGWGNWFNGPVADGWYASLGPGLSLLNSGIGIGEDPATPGVFKYGLLGTKGFLLQGGDDVSVMALFSFMMVFMATTATIPTGSISCVSSCRAVT
jgi:ammonium transporter, Amt family